MSGGAAECPGEGMPPIFSALRDFILSRSHSVSGLLPSCVKMQEGIVSMKKVTLPNNRLQGLMSSGLIEQRNSAKQKGGNLEGREGSKTMFSRHPQNDNLCSRNVLACLERL